MKQAIYTWAWIVLGMFSLQSCLDDASYTGENLLFAIGTIRVVEAQDYYFELDEGSLLYPGDTAAVHNYPIKDNQRAFVYFSLLEETLPGYDYNAKIEHIEDILTKDIFCVAPEDLDSIGNDRIDVDNIWQVFSYRVPSYDLSPQNEMVISFPADDSIRVYNLQTKQTRSYFAGYSVPYEIRPARSGSMADVTRSVYDQVQYSCIYYDRWHGLYYRILTLPVKEDYDINSRENLSRNLAVVILDKDFQKVGEYNVQEKSDRYAFMFVSPEGLHIQVLSDDDDYMTFMTLKPQKL